VGVRHDHDVRYVLQSARLQWKFKSEYDELREHLERSLLILLGWWLTIRHLTKAAAEHFIVSVLEFRISTSLKHFDVPSQKAQPDQAVSNLYKQSTKLSIHDIFSITVWGLLVPLFRCVRPLFLFFQVHVSARRYAVPRIVFPTLPFFSRSALSRFSGDKREEASANPALSPSPPDEQPVRSPYMESTAHAHPESSPTITVMSDPAHSALDGSLMDALKDGIERLQSAMHMGEGRPFPGSPSLDGDIRVRMGAFVISSVRTGGRG